MIISFRLGCCSLLILSLLSLQGCATTETAQAVAPVQVTSATQAAPAGQTVTSTLVVGKFDNRSNFMRGLFTDGVDQLGGQAKTLLMTHLQQANRFNVVDRTSMSEITQEAQIQGKKQQLRGANFVITGDVTEFGRKEVGDHQLFGILGRAKTQTAYAKVSLNVVDTLTSEVVFSVQGAGEYALSNREIVGFGATAAYDSTLNGKVLDLAVREAVQRLVEGWDGKRWGVRS